MANFNFVHDSSRAMEFLAFKLNLFDFIIYINVMLNGIHILRDFIRCAFMFAFMFKVANAPESLWLPYSKKPVLTKCDAFAPEK